MALPSRMRGRLDGALAVALVAPAARTAAWAGQGFAHRQLSGLAWLFPSMRGGPMISRPSIAGKGQAGAPLRWSATTGGGPRWTRLPSPKAAPV